MAAAPRRNSIWMSTGAGGEVDCAMETGTNCGTLTAVLADKVVVPGGEMAAPSRSRASLRQPCTMFAFTPCDIATLATEAPGAAHCSSTNVFNSALCRRRKTTLSAAIVSTYLLDGHDHWRHASAIALQDLALTWCQQRQRSLWQLRAANEVGHHGLGDAWAEGAIHRIDTPRPLSQWHRRWRLRSYP